MFRYAEELWSQPLAAQFIREPQNLVANRAIGQPFQSILVASADFIGRKSREF
jgi:hypothetical protein